MTLFRPLKKLAIFLNRRRFLSELDEEMEFHRLQAEKDLIASGLSPQEAHHAAMKQFGNQTRAREQSHEAVAFTVETILRDLYFAGRQLRRSPGFAFTALLTLTLGITANLIVFGIVQALVLRPLDVPDADKVISLGRGNNSANFSYPDVRDIRDRNTVLSAVAADRVMDFGLDANGVSRSVWGYEVSGGYFEVLNVTPLLGRLIHRDDDDRVAQVAVLSWQAWKNYFSSDPAIVGKTVRVNKHPYTIIGVTPRGFYGTEKFIQPEIFVPMSNEVQIEDHNWLNARYTQNIWAIARVRDGLTLPQVQAGLDAVASQIRKQFPKEEEGLSIRIMRPGLLGNVLGPPVRAFLLGIMTLAVIVLFAACANLGGLFAARTADRARELAIRMAIGSSRGRIFRQLVTEAFLIAVLSGLCASVLGWTVLAGLAAWSPARTALPIHFAVAPQPSLVLAAAVFSCVAAALFGLIPLRQILKADPSEVIKSGAAQSGAGRKWPLRDILLAFQIGLCCITITAAFVAIRGLGRSLSMELGFSPADVVRVQFELTQAGYSNEDAASFQRRLLVAASQLPGVQAIGYANSTPLSVDESEIGVFHAETTDMRPANVAFVAPFYSVSPGYFAAAGTPLLQGRDVSFADDAKAPPVAIVNQEFARRLFRSDNVVGRYFRNRPGQPTQIVGVVANGRYTTLNEEPSPAIFFPITQQGNTSTVLVVRTYPDPTGAAAREMAAGLRKTIAGLDPAVPIQECSLWSTQLGLQLLPARMATVALGLFGAFGVLLSLTGTFGLASYSVTKRLRELTIRVALGARAKQIFVVALGRMLLLLGIGSSVGLVLGAAASHLLSAVVYQASAQDPVVLIAAACTMLVTALVSIVNPVRRALRLDPASILREQ
ncbi:MAG TPA: ABC transporter permease [Acidobacteriaceae bacterium]|nr:ABC transporter permease [Acidobacteriaceae bacterium]